MKNLFDRLKFTTKGLTGSFKKLSFKKKLFFIGLACIVFIFLIGKINQLRQPLPYTIQKAEKSDITETVNETGNISAGGAVNIYSPSNGVVTNVSVANGDTVSEGQSLFKVHSSATQQEQQLANSNYLTAVASLNAAKSKLNTLRSEMFTEWKTFRDLATNSTYENSDKTPNLPNREAVEFNVAQNDWLASEAKVKDQQTAIAQAQAQTTSTWLSYQATQDSDIKAPASGGISNLSISEGSSVTVNSPTSPQTPVMVISSGAKNEVIVALGETDITKVEPGQNVKVAVDVLNKTYKGVVSRVDSIGIKTQGVITYNVYITLENPDSDLRSGMTLDAEITTKKLSGVLSVPNSAVKPYQGGKAVRFPGAKRGEVKYIPVIIGMKGKEKTQILKGIDEGQTIITSLANEQIKRPSLFGN